MGRSPENYVYKGDLDICNKLSSYYFTEEGPPITCWGESANNIPMETGTSTEYYTVRGGVWSPPPLDSSMYNSVIL